MNNSLFKLEFSYEQNAFHIVRKGDIVEPNNGYNVIHVSNKEDEIYELIELIRSIYDHPTYEEIELVINGFVKLQDTNL